MTRELDFSEKAQQDIEYWKKTGNIKIQKKIKELLLAVQETPFHGIGKPEALKYGLSGSWSPRIDNEHRIVYHVTEKFIKIESLKDHY